MALSREEVLHVAALCRVHLTEEELDRLQRQLSDILAQFELLQGLNTEGVPATGHLSLSTVMRPDTPSAPFPRDDVLANAPDRQDEFFRVLAVLEEP
jgi:aspartyl-tRNA(Asn)/glutamyl-tRNA(Gln) amidotransferase subunit C